MGLKTWLASRFASDGRSPWGNWWFEPITGRTMSGMPVSADTAMQLSAVFRAVGLVSGHMALLPVRFYESGTRKRIKKHPILTLLNKRPNRFQNAFEWREMLQGHLELRGNAYNEIIANSRGEITDLLPIHPDKCVPEQILSSGDYRYRITDPDGTQRTVPRGNIWHIRELSSNGITGVSRITCARESFGSALAAQSYGGRFFANDAKPTGGWIEYPGQFANKEARQIFREAIQDAQSASNKGKLMALDRGMIYHEVGMTNSDAQFLETRKASVSDIARWFGVPPHKIGDLDRSTNNNIEQQALEYIQDGLLPRGARWTSSISAELLFDDEEIDVEFDFTVLMRGDSASRANYITKMTNGGILTRNEGREIEGREPLEGLDEPLVPLNMVSAGQVDDDDTETSAQTDPANPDQPGLNPGNDQDESAKHLLAAKRLHVILSGNASRMARRIVKSGTCDALMLAEAMAVTPEAAVSWIKETLWSGKDIELRNITESLIKLGTKP